MARLREAMTALGVHGMCRLVAFELLTYWEPGGTVFPSVTTLADGLGVQPRIVRGHLARLERIDLWVRVARPGRANLYELRLPGFVSDEAEPRIVEGEPRIVGSAPTGSHDPPEVTTEVTKKITSAARARCSDCGNSWPAEYGDDCFQCLKARKSPDRRRSYFQTHGRQMHTEARAVRPDPPLLTPEQVSDLEAKTRLDGFRKRDDGTWTKF